MQLKPFRVTRKRRSPVNFIIGVATRKPTSTRPFFRRWALLNLLHWSDFPLRLVPFLSLWQGFKMCCKTEKESERRELFRGECTDRPSQKALGFGTSCPILAPALVITWTGFVVNAIIMSHYSVIDLCTLKGGGGVLFWIICDSRFFLNGVLRVPSDSIKGSSDGFVGQMATLGTPQNSTVNRFRKLVYDPKELLM